MKALWLCDLVLAEFCIEFGFKQNNFGGWMTGMLHQLKSEVEIALCFPIYNPERAKDGEYRNHKYYSFQFIRNEYNDCMRDRFKEIIKDYNPDIIHIWGTEYPNALAMVNAAEQLGLLNKVIINIQGLVSVCAKHYCNGVSSEFIDMKCIGFKTIQQDCEDFVTQGIYEEEALKKVRHVIGRTEWDKACVKRLKRDICYHFCGEILRDEFYKHVSEWEYEKCKKQSIFVSQAGYPLKGFHYLLKAMPDILRDYPMTCVYVAGNDITTPNTDGNISPYGVYIKKLIKEYCLEARVIFTGNLDEKEMIEMYLKANVFVSASSIENSPNSVCEAALIGCPVVASYVGGVPDIAEYIDRIELYQHDAEYMLAYKVKKVFKESIKMKKNDTDRIMKMLNSELNGTRTLEIYKSVLYADN